MPSKGAEIQHYFIKKSKCKNRKVIWVEYIYVHKNQDYTYETGRNIL